MRAESRTAVLDGRLVLLKTCLCCGKEGVCSPDDNSEFGIEHRRDDRPSVYRSHCKLCYRLLQRERARARRSTEAGRKAMNAATMRWHRKKLKQDPDYFNSTKRFRRRQETDEDGAAAVRTPPVVHTNGTPRVPMGPFLEWLRAYMKARRFETAAELAHDLDVEARRILSYLTVPQPFAALDVVDRALLNAAVHVDVAGVTIFTLEDLYALEPEPAELAA